MFLCNSGAEAVEAALKLVRRARTGGKVIVLHDAFHGRTFGALSATPQEAKQAPFAPLVPEFFAVPKDPVEIDRAVDEDTAAVLLEPIQGESGIQIVPEEVLRAARAACDRTGAALVFDEIQTGMGRTGTLWAYEQTGVVPDALTTAKALGGGLPIGALVTGPGLADVLQPGDHGSTFAGGPLIASAALVALELCSEPALLASVVTLGERLLAGLGELPYVRSTRGRGLMLAIDLAEGVSAPDAGPSGAARAAARGQRHGAGDDPPRAAAGRVRGRGRRGAGAAARARLMTEYLPPDAMTVEAAGDMLLTGLAEGGGTVRELDRTYLDTFDGLLHEDGLSALLGARPDAAVRPRARGPSSPPTRPTGRPAR